MVRIQLKSLAFTLACYLLMTPVAHAAPVVVELFTSQGCSSCPPADEFLADLREFGDILPLSFHVTYWNNIGWKDPYSSEASTERQRAYRDAFTGQLYTPQMIIQGAYQAVGSSRQDVLEKVSEIQRRAVPEVSVSMTRTDAGVLISFPTTGLAPKKPYQVWLLTYDDEHTTPIGAGENNGRSLRNINVVRSITPLPDWDGQGRNTVIPAKDLPAGTQNLALIVQEANMGPIVTAATAPLVSSSVLNNVQIDPTIDPSIGFNQPTQSQTAQQQQLEALQQKIQEAETTAQQTVSQTTSAVQQEFAKPQTLPSLPTIPAPEAPSLVPDGVTTLPASILPSEVATPSAPATPPSLLDSLPSPTSFDEEN